MDATKSSPKIPSASLELWNSACRLLENHSVTDHQFSQWIEPLQLLHLNDSSPTIEMELAAENLFCAEWVLHHFQTKIETAVEQVTGKPCKLKVSVNPKRVDALQSSVDPLRAPGGAGHVASGNLPTSGVVKGAILQSGEKTLTDRRMSLDPRFIFDNFVIGASNQFAYASAFAVAERPGHQYNPLFFYSAPGLGKTHLLHAIGNAILAKNPSSRIAYISAETFANELIDSIRHNATPAFRMKYRNSYDVLLFDDIQFIAGKKQTEEEFFHTFNELYGLKKQLVLTSDRPPKEIEKLEERIRTRFECGLVADIQPPEIETRIAILKAKAENNDIYLPDDVATFLATYVKNNVRELEGILIRLQAQAQLTGAEISLEMAKHEFKLSIPEENSQLTVENIQSTVCKYFQIRPNDLKSNSREKKYALPRQITMYLIRRYTGLGFKEIGHYFGGRDHTTVMHACNKVRQEVELGLELKHVVEAVQNLL